MVDQPEGSRIIFLPALTVARFLRAFAVSQAAVCFVNGAALAAMHNPLTGGTLKSATPLSPPPPPPPAAGAHADPPLPSRDAMLGAGLILFGALTLRGISAYVTCHISRIDVVDDGSLLVKSLAMPFGDRQQLVARHAFPRDGQRCAAPAPAPAPAARCPA